LGCVEIFRWFAAPRYDFFIDTLTPLTLFDVVVLSHALRWRGRWHKNSYNCLIYRDLHGAKPLARVLEQRTGSQTNAAQKTPLKPLQTVFLTTK
jgi:hypothetical protein